MLPTCARDNHYTKSPIYVCLILCIFSVLILKFRKQVLYCIQPSRTYFFPIHYVTKIHLCCYMQFIHFHCYKNLHSVKISSFIHPFFTLWAFGLFPNSAAMNTPIPVLTPTISHTIVKAILCFWTCVSGKVIMITNTCLMCYLLQSTLINVI